jgi:hypothetical protein
VQPETYIRGNKNKKKIKQADFPAEAPESNSNKCETGNAEHSMHDLSSESAKECSVTESESYYRAKNESGAFRKAFARARGMSRKLSLKPYARAWHEIRIVFPPAPVLSLPTLARLATQCRRASSHKIGG